jgi:hypothetical protein
MNFQKPEKQRNVDAGSLSFLFTIGFWEVLMGSGNRDEISPKPSCRRLLASGSVKIIIIIIIIIIINYLTSPAGHLAGDPLPPEG